MHNPCAVIPVYNHETAVPDVVQALLAAGLPCVLVDDASSPACSAVLEQLAQGPGIHLIRLAINQGKGGAVMAGLREAERLGFSWEGRLRHKIVRKGRTRDSDILSIINDEWSDRDAVLRRWLAASNFDEQGRQRQPLAAFR